MTDYSVGNGAPPPFWRVALVCVALLCMSMAALLRSAQLPELRHASSIPDIHRWSHFKDGAAHLSFQHKTGNAAGKLPTDRMVSDTGNAFSDESSPDWYFENVEEVALSDIAKERSQTHSNIGLVQLADKDFQLNQVLQYATIRAYANAHGYDYHLIDPEETAPHCQEKHADFFYRKHCAVGEFLAKQRPRYTAVVVSPEIRLLFVSVSNCNCDRPPPCLIAARWRRRSSGPNCQFGQVARFFGFENRSHILRTRLEFRNHGWQLCVTP